jgi:hypothetical protein
MKVLDLMLELGVATDTNSSNHFHVLCEKFPTQSTRFDTNWSCKILAIKYVKDGEEHTVKYDDLPCESVRRTDHSGLMAVVSFMNGKRVNILITVTCVLIRK